MSEAENWNDKYLKDPRSTDELIAIVLAKDIDADNEEYWSPLRSLQYRLGSIIERIERLLESEGPKTRESAALVLGQNSVKEKWDVPRCAKNLLHAIELEKSAQTLSSMLHAVGSLHDAQQISAVARFEKHPNADVRYAVVHALSGFEDEEAISSLIRLSADSDPDVRNWATFGLGSQIDADTPPIRDALLARVTDSEDEIRGEAMVGLALRGDLRVIRSIMNELSAHQANVLRDWSLMVDTANAIAESSIANRDQEWVPVLQRFAELQIGDEQKIRAAINLISQRNE